MGWDKDPRGEVKSSLFLGIVFLFFIQVVTTWIESIYRLSLIKLSMGVEMLGILLVLLPLALLIVPRRYERHAMHAALAVLLITRALVPMLGAAALIVIAGLGVAAFLVFLCFVLAGRVAPRGDMVVGAGLAVLLSILFRAWGSSLDISMGGWTAVFGWLLVIAAWLLRPRYSAAEGFAGAEAGSAIRALGPILLFFASFTLIYLVLSSPAVVSAWAGSNYVLGTILLLASLVLVIGAYALGKTVPRRLLLAWNVLFVASLVGGILLHRIGFPATPESPAVVVYTPSAASHLPLYLMFIFSPVLVLNMLVVQAAAYPRRPRGLVIPVLLGMAFLVAVTLLLIFTNTWGYVGAIGLAMRNKFYLPFLIAGLAMILPLVISKVVPARARRQTPVVAATLAVLALLAVAGLVVRSISPGRIEARTSEIIVMTYNFQQGSEPEGDQNYAGQLAFIRAVDPDIIGLQESDTPRPSGGNVDAARYFADALGYHVYYGPNTISGTYGTAILSRFPLENPRTFFTYSDVDEVGTAVAEFTHDGRRVAFLNSHPAGSDAVKHAHVDALIAEAAKYEHVISVGDYNFRQDSPYYAKLTAVLNDSWLSIYPDAIGQPGPGAQSTGPLDMTRRIDHIFVSDSFDAVESYYVPEPESQTDHPAHWSVLRWR
jgi:endonuclease/exonuclease/phosphatase family metal-dependent hydrolase